MHIIFKDVFSLVAPHTALICLGFFVCSFVCFALFCFVFIKKEPSGQNLLPVLIAPVQGAAGFPQLPLQSVLHFIDTPTKRFRKGKWCFQVPQYMESQTQ